MRKIKEHTQQKLKYFEKYLNAYLNATKRLSKKYYIDAFAGTGKCILDKTNEIKDGSTLIALKSKKPFDIYVFIEKDKDRFKELEQNIKNENIDENRRKNIKLKNDDANIFLSNISKYISDYNGCLIFLDPEGPELFWNTIIYLAKIKKVDILILYPYDMSLVRLTKDYKEKLDKFYGDPKWLNIYNKRNNPSDAREKLLHFYTGNLRKLGFTYTTYRQIRKNLRSGKPLYHLILATRNYAGVKIMEDIFGKELDNQKKLIKI